MNKDILNLFVLLDAEFNCHQCQQALMKMLSYHFNTSSSSEKICTETVVLFRRVHKL